MSIEQELIDLMESDNKDVSNPSDEENVTPTDTNPTDLANEPPVSLENPLTPNFDVDAVKDAEEDEGGVAPSSDVAVKESVTELLVGEELSEEFKFKAATLFEAAVKNQVEDIRETLSEDFNKQKQELTEAFAEKQAQLETQFETSLTEAKQEYKVQLSEKIDAFLDTLAEQWLSHNEVALEHGLKTELTESFIDGMKSLFEAHYVDLPEEKFDVVSEMETKNAELQKTLSEQIQYAAEIKANYDSVTRDIIISESAKGLTDLDQARFNKLVEDIEFGDKETFKKRVGMIKESFFRSTPSQSINESKQVVLDTKVIVEEVEQVETPKTDRMSTYLKYLGGK